MADEDIEADCTICGRTIRLDRATFARTASTTAYACPFDAASLAQIAVDDLGDVELACDATLRFRDRSA